MEELTAILLEELEIFRNDVIQRSKDAGQEASGNTYNNIVVHVEQTDRLRGYVTAPSYFYTLIRGRGPGGVPMNMAEIIMEWAQHKGISFDSPESLLRFARAVAWTIRREGTQLYRDHLAIDLIDTPAREFYERMRTRITRAYRLQIINALKADNIPGHGYIV